MSKHGTPSGYTNLKCRDNCCRKAWAQDTKERRHKQRSIEVMA